MAKPKQKTDYKQSRKSKNNWLPIILGLGGVVVILIALYFVFGRPASKYQPEVIGAPSLKADKDMVDFGDVKLGDMVKVSFELKNVGDQTLNFSEPPYIEVVEGC